jgi:hypothetical protein
MKHTYLIILIITTFLLIAAGVLLPLYFLKWKDSNSKTLAAGTSAGATVSQVNFNIYFSVAFFTTRTRVFATAGIDKYIRTDTNQMCKFKSDSLGRLFTFADNENTLRVPTDVDLIGATDGVNTNRSLQEICGGTETNWTFIPFFATLWNNVMVATDVQINAKLASLAADSKAMETSPTQNNGVFYIGTDSVGKYTSLNVGKIENGRLVPITNRNYGFNVPDYPNSAFVFANPTFNITQIISTSAYNTIFGPYASPTFNQSMPQATKTSATLPATSPIYTAFRYSIPMLFVLDVQNELNPLTGKVTILKTPQMPASALTPYLKPGVSIMSMTTAQSIFGLNLSFPFDISINGNGVEDQVQNYGIFYNSSSNLVYAVYDNPSHVFTIKDVPKHAMHVMLIGTSLTQSNPDDVVDLSILGRTFSSVAVQPVTIPSPPILPLPNPPATPEEVQQQAFYETIKDHNKSVSKSDKLLIYILAGVVSAIIVAALIYVLIRFYFKKQLIEASVAVPAAPTSA